ncbi:MAG TPA: adenylate/guanylate cyclase domain-containing protein [Anaerolineae bacterium]|nr:adenylate/guanylate cyclase domain-containing protein [Anaerolineae bacterium]
MTDASPQVQLEQLRASLQVLESQRALLGAAIDPALDAVRTQIAALEAQLIAPTQSEERCIITVLFSDIVGSTALAENMDAEDWRTVVNIVHTLVGQAIQKYNGAVMQYQGDGVVAMFGFPTPHEQDPENAIRAGLEIQAELARLETQPRIQMRVGIHTGLVLLGSIGSNVKHEYSGFGDPMNLAARLQAAAPTGGVLISHDTYRYVRGVFDMTAQPPIMVKGKSAPIQTYVVERARPRPFRTVTRGVAGIEVQTIGREAELQKIQAAFETVYHDRAVTWVQIIGEPGMGKSRLLDDARDALDLRPERFRWLRARAFQGDEKHAFMLVRRMWFDRFQIAEDAPLAEAEARWLDQFATLRGPDQVEAAQALGLLLGLPFHDSPHIGALRHDPAQVKGRAYVVSRELLSAMRAELPIVMLLEDAQWLDPSSWDYLVNLLLAEAPTSQQGILVVATARSEWNPPAALLKYTGYQPINLKPLSEAACRSLVLALLQRVEDAPDSAVRLVVQRSEGVPYYVEEIINWFLDHGIIDTTNEPWQFDATRFHEEPLPTTLQHLLLTRLSALTEAERVTLQYGSIFGRNLWEGGLAALGLPDCASTLKRLQPRGFVDAQPESSLAGEKEWSFHHNLLQAVAYESLLKRVRRQLHKAAAVWLEDQARQAGRLDEFVGILADHLDRAGDKVGAADWYLRAGAYSHFQGAFLEARISFERALELVPPSDHLRRWQAWLGRNDAVSHLSEHAAYQQSVEALLELAQYLGPLYLAEAHYRRALLIDAVGDYPASYAEYQIALVNAREGHAVALELRIMGMMLICQNRLSDAAGATATARHMLSRLDEVEGIDSIDALINLAVYYVESGDLARAAQLHQEQATIAQRLGERRKQATALMNLGYDYQCLGMYETGRETLEQALRLFESFGARRELAYARLNLGLIYWRSADIPAALNTFKSVQPELAALGDTFAEAAGLSYLAIVLGQRGEAGEAQAQFETARSIFTQAGTRGYAMDALAGLVRCALTLGDLEAVKRRVAELWNYLRLQGTQGMEFPLWAYLTCAEAYTALGENDKARKSIAAGYSELLTRADKISRVEWGRSYLFNVPEHRALIDLWEQIAQ